MRRLSQSGCFGGTMSTFEHASEATGTTMRFGLFLPEGAARTDPPPALYCLAGLTCTDENFAQKAGAQRFAALHRLALVFPDTSPRGNGVPDVPDRIDIGLGAGFYLRATEGPWAPHYDMSTYVAHELPDLVEAEFPVAADRRGIVGHSMGGHGALVLALREPDRFRSVSALSPIANPSVSEWGSAAFRHYLGPDPVAWQAWDACRLVADRPRADRILVDQGSDDPHLENLRPHALREAADRSGQRLELRMHPGYDHGYWFVQTVIADHITHHAASLRDH